MCEKTRRQRAIRDRRFVPTGNGTQVWTRPNELVRFGDNYPRPIGVQPQSFFCFNRNFNCVAEVHRLGVGDRQDEDDVSAAFIPQGHNNRARSVLTSLFSTCFVLMPPQIGIANDHSGKRHRKFHGFQSLSSSLRWSYFGSILEFAIASISSSVRSLATITRRSRRLRR